MPIVDFIYRCGGYRTPLRVPTVFISVFHSGASVPSGHTTQRPPPNVDPNVEPFVPKLVARIFARGGGWPSTPLPPFPFLSLLLTRPNPPFTPNPVRGLADRCKLPSGGCKRVMTHITTLKTHRVAKIPNIVSPEILEIVPLGKGYTLWA